MRDAVERRAARRSPRLRRASVVTTEYRKSAPTTLSLFTDYVYTLTSVSISNKQTHELVWPSPQTIYQTPGIKR